MIATDRKLEAILVLGLVAWGGVVLLGGRIELSRLGATFVMPDPAAPPARTRPIDLDGVLTAAITDPPPAQRLPAWVWHRRPALIQLAPRVDRGPTPSHLAPTLVAIDADPGCVALRVTPSESNLYVVVRHEVWRRQAPEGTWSLLHETSDGPFEWIDRTASFWQRHDYRVISVARLDEDHPAVTSRRTPALPAGDERRVTYLTDLQPARAAFVRPLLLHEGPDGVLRVDLEVRRWSPKSRAWLLKTCLAVGSGDPIVDAEGNDVGATVLTTTTTHVDVRWPGGWEERLPLPR